MIISFQSMTRDWCLVSKDQLDLAKSIKLIENPLLQSTNTKNVVKLELIYICSLYTLELLYFSKRLKKKLVEACIVLHVSHSCSQYLLRSYDALHPYHTCIKNCKTKYEFAGLCLRPTFSQNKQNIGVQTIGIFKQTSKDSEYFKNKQ